MARISTSVSFSEENHKYLKNYCENSDAKASTLINRLLKEYFTGDRSEKDNSMVDIRYDILLKQTEKLKEEVAAQWEAIHAAMSDHGVASEKRISEKEKKEDQILERLEKEFSDIPISDGVHQYRAWARSQKLEGADPQGILKNRIVSVASHTGASKADVMEIVVRDYPGIIDLLNTNPGVL